MKWQDVVKLHGEEEALEALAEAQGEKSPSLRPYAGNEIPGTEEYGRFWRIYFADAGGELLYEEVCFLGEYLPGEYLPPEEEEPAVFEDPLEDYPFLTAVTLADPPWQPSRSRLITRSNPSRRLKP